VLAANGVDVMLALSDEYTPTPAISHAILTHNRGRSAGLADGIVITPSHNPPDNGGPADTGITAGIEAAANRYLEAALSGVKRVPYAQALRASTTHRHDFLDAYVTDLGSVIDFDMIRSAVPVCTTGRASPSSTASTSLSSATSSTRPSAS